MNEAERLNADCDAAGLNQAALQQAVRAQGEAWHSLVTERCPYLFADVPVFVTSAWLRQMRDVIAAVERVVNLPGWCDAAPLPQPLMEPLAIRLSGETAKSLVIPRRERGGGLGVFYGYDFHLNEQGAHLIEINTNAGGAFLNALLIDSQRDVKLPGETAAQQNLPQVFLDMFRNEWRLERGSAPLKTIAIVDELPEGQYLYPEFLLAKSMFEHAGITAYIADPSELKTRDDALYLDGNRIDLVYNRLTDFSLQHHANLRQAYLGGGAVVTPNPAHYARYADKRNLAQLSDAEGLRKLGTSENDVNVLQAGVPHTFIVKTGSGETLWQQRKELFFKPNSGYGSRGAYRGEKLTRRVFGEILQADYVAQKLAAPGERAVCVEGGEPHLLKYDVRCYVYDGQIQLVAARLYQGQTTNFRTQGGGFALVRLVE